MSSSAYLLGNFDMAYSGTTKFWADKGIIHWEDSLTNTYGTISVEDALERAECIKAMIGKSTDPGIEVDQAERERMMTFVEKMLMLVRKAQEQGSPSDPTCYTDLELKQRRQFRVTLPFGMQLK